MFEATGYPVEIRSGVIVSGSADAKAVRDQATRPQEPAQFPIRLRSSRRLVDRLRGRMPGGRVTYISEGLDEAINWANVALEVGGDNYTLDYGPPWEFVDMDLKLKASKLPVYIWGASVGPFAEMPAVEVAMVQHFNTIDGVFVREKLSYDDLIEKGLDNVHRMTDPAIFMDPVMPHDLGFEIEAFRGAVGLNFSPFQTKGLFGNKCEYWEVSDMDLAGLADLGADLVQQVLNTHGRPIVLLPHVFGPQNWNNDYHLLSAIHGKIDASNRHKVALPSPSLSAPELKWIVSHCSVFAGSRTHSTIAAISAGVPTLAFGYSRKAKGLMLDLYGVDTFCIPSDEFSIQSALAGISRLIEGETTLRNHIESSLQAWRKTGFAAANLIMQAATKAN